MKSFLLICLFCISFSAISQDLAVSHTNPNSFAEHYYKKANASLNGGDEKQAISYYHKIIRFYKKEDRQTELSENYFAMALSFGLNGHYHNSIRFYKKALKAHKRYRNNTQPIEILMNMGLTYQLAGKDQKAEKYLSKG